MLKKVLPVIGLIVMIASCEYREIGEVSYSEQKIYMPAAAVADVGVGLNGTYNISSVAVPGQNFRYVIDNAQNKFNIPLGVLRSGAILDGAVNVNISTPTDTLQNLLTSGVLTNTEIVPADRFSIEPAVTVSDGQGSAKFTLSLDLDYLLADSGKKYAIAVHVSSAEVASFEKYSTTVIIIDPQFLTPTALFTAIVTDKVVAFSNTSVNGLSYEWNFGDGSPTVNTVSPSYTYAAAGTYTVTLTATGALGETNKSVKTETVIVP